MERCQHILSAVSNLSPTETDELFKILASTKCEYSQNDNGIFINLRWVGESVLHKIEQFMAFCNKNRIELEKYERLRKILTENFAAAATAVAASNSATAQATATPFAIAGEPDDEEAADVPEAVGAVGQERAVIAQVPSIVGGMTTLKFNLLKKKFAKPYNASSRFEQGDLIKEPNVL